MEPYIKKCARCGRKLTAEVGYRPTARGLVCRPCLQRLWRQKGYAAERDLVRRLRKLGFSAHRVPTSGAGKENLPDLMAFKQPSGPALAFEVKAVSLQRWTVYAWKEKRGKREPSQIVKCMRFLREMYPPDMEKHAAVAVKFLLGERRKSPWVIRFVPNHEDLTQVEDMVVDIADPSNLLISRPSKRARAIVRKRKKKLKAKA